MIAGRHAEVRGRRGGGAQGVVRGRDGEDERQGQRTAPGVEERRWQLAQLGAQRQPLQPQLQRRAQVADIGPQGRIERILAAAGVVAREAQVQSVVGQEQGRFDGNLDLPALGAVACQRQGHHRLVVDEHVELRLVGQQGRGIGEIQHQGRAGHHLVSAQDEGDAGFAADAQQTHGTSHAHVGQGDGDLAFAAGGGPCGFRRLGSGPDRRRNREQRQAGQERAEGRGRLDGGPARVRVDGTLGVGLGLLDAPPEHQGGAGAHEVDQRGDRIGRRRGGVRLPGVGSSHDGHHQLAVLGDRHGLELHPQGVARHRSDARWKGGPLRAAQQLHGDRLALVDQSDLGDGEAAHRDLVGFGPHFPTVAELQDHRQVGADPDIGAHLPGLAADRQRGRQDQQAEQGPAGVQQQGAQVHTEPADHQLGDADGEPQNQQADHRHVRPHQPRVEIALVEQAALFGHVELAALGIEQGADRRDHQVEGQQALVDLAPEGPAILALNAVAGGDRLDQMRQGEGGDHRSRGEDDVLAEQQERQRRGQEHDARQREEEVQHRVEVAKPLGQAQAGPGQGIVDPEDLDHPPRPARALADVQGQALGGEPRGQADVEIGAVPAASLQLERGVGVLGHRLAGEAVGFVQRLAADHRAGAAEEGRVPEVVAGLNHAVEQRALVGHVLHRAQVPLHGIGRIEVVRGLQQGQARIGLEPAHRHLQEGPGRDVVGVEDADQFAVGQAQGVVQVAGLGVLVVVAGDVEGAGGLGEGLELGTPPVVEHVDAEAVARIVHRQRGQDGVLHDLQTLVIGRDEDVDRGPSLRFARERADRSRQRPDGLDVA